MKTIEEALNEAWHKALEIQPNFDPFKAGVEFAQKWYCVNEELPEDSERIIQHGKCEYTESAVLIKTTNGRYSVCKRTRFNDGSWKWIGSSGFNSSVTHWRPIELH